MFRKNEKITIESIVSDIDGKLIASRDVEIKATLKDWVFEKSAWIEKVIDEQTCNVKSLGDKAQLCEFIAKQGGQYTITARVLDDRERPNESQFTVWVPGGKTPPKRTVEQEEAQIIPNKKDFAPNDVAELLVISPFPNAEGVLDLAARRHYQNRKIYDQRFVNHSENSASKKNICRTFTRRLI